MKKSKPRVAVKKKPPARSKAGSSKFSPGEYVRIVPLHYPKPSLSIDELGRLKGEPPDTDLFDGQPHVAAATAHTTTGRSSRASRCSRSSGARSGARHPAAR